MTMKTYHIRVRARGHRNQRVSVGGFNTDKHDKASLRAALERYLIDQGYNPETHARKCSLRAGDYFEPQCPTY